MPKGISLDFQFTSPIDRVWTAMTDPITLSKWMYPNDFKAVVGHKFQFRAEPSQWWDGIVNCEVLEIEEPNKLKYSWISGGEMTVVTWTMEQADDGTTRAHLEQWGFEGEQSFQGASWGWPRMVDQLQAALAQL
jgi:uncharacterized protein YndB with AHSA1/START domain